ncbi:polyprenyl diphosphate synthase [Suttonella sp. R2A3]|uniref:polyprenyl diphosphate synthase n=1 Tax=Suttonella sp. R2A3 TaxID=2908648 RepID=UPI001F031AF3|nr:polyprenyl diphosphate synthase [Suttonella sp. R2A3]UJF24636.1 polyprenyl diphosphate synthase [Suttonella sp. R2A3]
MVGDAVIAPSHVAIIMDGNGRWAKARKRPRVFGHRAGRDAVDRSIEACVEAGVNTLTLFAFSTENWRRPASEVSVLMELMGKALREYVPKLIDHGVALEVLGAREGLSQTLCAQIDAAEEKTAQGQKMRLVLALNYSGHWALHQAAVNLAQARLDDQTLGELDEAAFAAYLPKPHLPPVDLLIRTSGEQRISNFLLWELAYAELYFTDTLWPDFDAQTLHDAFAAYHARERRFGCLPQQEN